MLMSLSQTTLLTEETFQFSYPKWRFFLWGVWARYEVAAWESLDSTFFPVTKEGDYNCTRKAIRALGELSDGCWTVSSHWRTDPGSFVICHCFDDLGASIYPSWRCPTFWSNFGQKRQGHWSSELGRVSTCKAAHLCSCPYWVFHDQLNSRGALYHHSAGWVHGAAGCSTGSCWGYRDKVTHSGCSCPGEVWAATARPAACIGRVRSLKGACSAQCPNIGQVILFTLCPLTKKKKMCYILGANAVAASCFLCS